jgi:MFS family permease
MSKSEQISHPQSAFRKWLPMGIIALSIAIIVIDGTVLNVSQKSIINDLGTDLKTIQWAFTSYSLVIAALTIFGGRLGDLYGRKKMFKLGAILFAIGSFLTTISPNVGVLLLGWSLIEGVGAALMTPAASALLVSNYEGRDRGTAFAIFGATAGGASAFGPIIGGFLAKYGTNISSALASLFSFNSTISNYFAGFSGWRWAFGINVIIVLLLLIGSRFLKDFHTKTEHKINLDLPGVVLSSVGLTAMVYGIIESSTYGWFTAKKAYEMFGSSYDLAGLSITPYLLLVGLISLVAFIFWELRVEKMGKEPMIRVEIFNNPTFSFGILTLTTLFGGFTGIITYGVVFFFLTVLQFDSLGAGLALIPLSIMVFIMAPLSAKFSPKFGGKNIVQFGIALTLIGTALMYTEFSPDATVWTFIPSLVIFGMGFGMMMAQINNLILSSVDVKLAGVASGINGTIREVGRSFGTALIGAAFISTLGSTLKDNLNSNNNINIQAKQAIIQSIDNGEVNAGTSSSKSDSEVLGDANNQKAISGIVAGAKAQGKILPQSVAEKAFLDSYRTTESEISEEVKKSITEGSKTAITYTGVFILISFMMSFGLPSSKKKLSGEVVKHAIEME